MVQSCGRCPEIPHTSLSTTEIPEENVAGTQQVPEEATSKSRGTTEHMVFYHWGLLEECFGLHLFLKISSSLNA